MRPRPQPEGGSGGPARAPPTRRSGPGPERRAAEGRVGDLWLPCSCFSTDTHWFSGPRCEVAVRWKALVGGLAGAAALGLLLAGLSVFFARSRRSSRGVGR